MSWFKDAPKSKSALTPMFRQLPLATRTEAPFQEGTASQHAGRLQRWIRQLHERKGYHKTLIATANKHGRMLSAMLAKERYDAHAWQRHPMHPLSLPAIS
jgi:hypothetical protein